MKPSTFDEIFLFAESIINKPISDESEFINSSAIIKSKKQMLSLLITKMKSISYIEDIPMLVPVDKPDTPDTAIKLMFHQCLNEGLKSRNGIIRGFEIIKNKRGFNINIQISEKQFNEPFWDLDDISESEKENRINKIMDKVVSLIKKSGVSGVSKTEIAYILKNYSPDVRDCIKEGLEYSSFIVKDFRSIKNSKKKSLFYVYQNPVETEEDKTENE